MLSQKGGTESYCGEPNSDHHGRRARIVVWSKGGLDDTLGAADEPHRGQRVAQERDALTGRGAVNGPRLTGGAGRLVMGVMSLDAGRLDMRRHAPISPFGEWCDGDNELGGHREEGDDAQQPAAVSCCDRAIRRHSLKATANRVETLAEQPHHRTIWGHAVVHRPRHRVHRQPASELFAPRAVFPSTCIQAHLVDRFCRLARRQGSSRLRPSPRRPVNTIPPRGRTMRSAWDAELRRRRSGWRPIRRRGSFAAAAAK